MLRLALNAIVKYLSGLFLVGVLLFLPAGTFSFFNAWLLIALLFGPMLLFGIILLLKDPGLLQKRLDAKEAEKTQKRVVALFGLLFVAGFVLAGLNHRFAWSVLPDTVVVTGAILLLISYGLYVEVMRENAFLSRTVKVQSGQRVVDTGLYGFVRHPMYAVTLLLFMSFALVLGCFWSFLCFLGFVPLFVIRIVNEEKVLERDLCGYSDYKLKVKFRLLPFIW
ncbi:MAG: isoprenylcysteine carboxylmethyltransferase family protein [Ruminococcaceae bacterium]|nr:isoprenylcysteine carboxylmethyltransferase family protein [Oscillospiraceae bacterium]